MANIKEIMKKFYGTSSVAVSESAKLRKAAPKAMPKFNGLVYGQCLGVMRSERYRASREALIVKNYITSVTKKPMSEADKKSFVNKMGTVAKNVWRIIKKLAGILWTMIKELVRKFFSDSKKYDKLVTKFKQYEVKLRGAKIDSNTTYKFHDTKDAIARSENWLGVLKYAVTTLTTPSFSLTAEEKKELADKSNAALGNAETNEAKIRAYSTGLSKEHQAAAKSHLNAFKKIKKVALLGKKNVKNNAKEFEAIANLISNTYSGAGSKHAEVKKNVNKFNTSAFVYVNRSISNVIVFKLIDGKDANAMLPDGNDVSKLAGRVAILCAQISASIKVTENVLANTQKVMVAIKNMPVQVEEQLSPEVAQDLRIGLAAASEDMEAFRSTNSMLSGIVLDVLEYVDENMSIILSNNSGKESEYTEEITGVKKKPKEEKEKAKQATAATTKKVDEKDIVQ